MGHAGTLDPFATGLLPVLLGRATRLVDYISGQSKTYEAVVELGRRTLTGDTESDTIQTAPVPDLTDNDFTALVPRVLAITQQTPPTYSAIKLEGRRACDLARKGADVELTPRPVRIERFTVLQWNPPCLRYTAHVSKGTYIRVLSESVAALLGTVGVTVELRRTSIGALQVTDATPLEEVTLQSIVSPLGALGHLPHATLPEDRRASFAHGHTQRTQAEGAGPTAVVGEDGALWGIADLTEGVLHPRVVLL